MRVGRISSALSIVLAGSLSTVLLAQAARATVAYSVHLVATTANPDFGLGVMLRETLTGTFFFDDADITPDGTRQKSVSLGLDRLTIAGVSFDAILQGSVESFWRFAFAGGMPLCIGDNDLNGCNGIAGQISGPMSNTYIEFSENSTGSAGVGGTETIEFEYSFLAVPESSTGLLLALGLVALGVRSKYRARRQP